jgi:hypothetical protein
MCCYVSATAVAAELYLLQQLTHAGLSAVAEVRWVAFRRANSAELGRFCTFYLACKQAAFCVIVSADYAACMIAMLRAAAWTSCCQQFCTYIDSVLWSQDFDLMYTMKHPACAGVSTCVL